MLPTAQSIIKTKKTGKSTTMAPIQKSSQKWMNGRPWDWYVINNDKTKNGFGFEIKKEGVCYRFHMMTEGLWVLEMCLKCCINTAIDGEV